MKLSKCLCVLLVAVLVLGMITGCTPQEASTPTPAPPATDPTPGETVTEPEAPAELVIGMIQDLTGLTGQQGTGAQRGVQMMVEEINAAGGINGTTMIRLVEYDIKGDVTESINAFKRLCDQDNVDIVIGPHISNIGIALAPLSEQYKVPIVGAYIDDRTVLKEDGTAYRYMFIAQPSATQQAQVIASYALEELGAETFAILYNAANAYCVSLQGPFIEYVEANGGTILAVEGFQDADKDYRTQLTKLKNLNPDAVYMPNYPAQVPLCVQQAREVGITVPLLGANGYIPNIYLAEAAAENETYIPYNIDYDNEAIKAFDVEFQAKWSFETNAQTYIAMDALSVVVEAFKKCGTTDSEALTDAINGVVVQGWMGEFSISPDTHMPVGMPMAILNVIGGKANTVTTVATMS